MLVLTRKTGESIHVGDDVEIVVEEIGHNQVRIGIDAPEEVPIYREEIYETNRASSSDASPHEERDDEQT
jgi:carbon storage regulator